MCPRPGGLGQVECEVTDAEQAESTEEAEQSAAQRDSRRDEHETDEGDEVDVALAIGSDARVPESDQVVDRRGDDLQELSVMRAAPLGPEPGEQDRDDDEADDDEESALHGAEGSLSAEGSLPVEGSMR